MGTSEQGPQLVLRFTYRATQKYDAGSLEIVETVLLPQGTNALGAARIAFDVVEETRRRMGAK
jgi:hypothetical protein